MLTTKNVDRAKLPQMMLEYVELKDKFPNDIVAYRVGDFFETYFEDALPFSKIGGLTLTAKTIGQRSAKKRDEKYSYDEIMNSKMLIPMAGVPHKSLLMYANKLMAEGHRIIVVEQLEDPKDARAANRNVRRGIVKILGGIDKDGEFLEENFNNFICVLYMENDKFAVSFADVITNDTYVTNFSSITEVINEISRYKPNEIILNNDIFDLIGSELRCNLGTNIMITVEDCVYTNDNKGLIEDVCNAFNIQSIDELGYNSLIELKSLRVLLNYIKYTQKIEFAFSKLPSFYTFENYLEIDPNSRLNLELTESVKERNRNNTLLSVLDNCKTSMGKRLLKQWIDKPLQNRTKIENRLEAISELILNKDMLVVIQENLNGILDVSRIIGKLKLNKAIPRDLVNLRDSFRILPNLYDYLSKFNSPILKDLYEHMDICDALVFLLDSAIVDTPASDVREGLVIKTGYNADLDRARDMVENASKYITELESREIEKTGIKNLRIVNKDNKYTLEVTKGNLSKVPSYYKVEKALKGQTRYTIDELDKLEKDLITALERSKTIEINLYEQLKSLILDEADKILMICDVISNFDVLCGLSSVAVENNYVKPSINTQGYIKIENGRHPVVELSNGETFVPNDLNIDMGSNNFLLITGPNMAGKSTYMRQVALITIMAHIGSFVPATYADICITDRVFTRIGASDDISSGRSTYMVEMTEVKNILENATKNSLVLLDEVGRGTSTSDGLSIAQAVTEYMIKNIGCKTLFATHYHELIALEESLKGLKNYHMAVEKENGTLKFIRKVELGGLSESYGIDVAQLAGISNEIIERARNILNEIENKAEHRLNVDTVKEEDKVIKKLKGIERSTVTPVTAYKMLLDLIDLL